METIIQSNGSKWAGQEPDSIDTLLDVLGREPLDSKFETYGNFFGRMHKEDWVNPNTDFAKQWTGAMSFFGNFKNYSHVFNILTFDQNIIVKLIDAIENNKQRPDYGQR